MSSPYKNAVDSPSRQLLWELGRLALNTQKDYYERLDRESRQREETYQSALAAAAVEHDRVRQQAETERGQLEKQLLEEQARRDEEEQNKALEKARQEKAEREIADKRKEIERVKTAQLEEQRAEKFRKDEVEKKKLEKERQGVEAARQLKERQVAEAQAKSAAASAAAARRQPSIAVNTSTAPQVQTLDRREVEHRRYLEIHRELKELRKSMILLAKQDARLKQRMGDIRRDITKCVGQLTLERGANKQPVSYDIIFKLFTAYESIQLAQTISVLRKAASMEEPAVDVKVYLAAPPIDADDSKGSALLLYELNIFAKAIINQFINEAGSVPKAADPIGTIASHVFALDDFRWKGLTLIDILIAKLHVVCPVLFGIYGSESTTQGRIRLGWDREDDEGAWVPEQRHTERMTGLGAGFAAIALRNYEKAKLTNPYPPYNYWKAMANIVNTPPREVSQTHFMVLKAMVQNNETRFLEFFGDAGLVALKTALVTFPKSCIDQSPAAKSVAVLPDLLKRDKKLIL